MLVKIQLPDWTRCESEGIVKHCCVATRTPERGAEARASVPKWQGSPQRQGFVAEDNEKVQGCELRGQEKLGVEAQRV